MDFIYFIPKLMVENRVFFGKNTHNIWFFAHFSYL